MKPTPISAAEAKQMLDRGEGIAFVDARNPVAWGEAAARVAQLLVDQGRQDVRYLQGGFDAWRRAGYPLNPK